MEESKRHIESLHNFSRWLGVPSVDGSVERGLFQGIDFAPSQDSLGAPLYDAALDAQFHSAAKRMGIEPAPFWPDGHPYVLCVTHDMDRLLSTIQRAKRLKRHPLDAVRALCEDIPTALQRCRWSENSYFPFRPLLDLQKELGFRSALYVLFEKRRWGMALSRREMQHLIGVYRPESIGSELVDFQMHGNEIGIHASFDSYCDLLALRRDKATLESLGITDVRGVRNHYLNYREEVTPFIQKAAGLLYDSTQGFNFRAGFRTGTCFPYLRDGIWELPFQLMDSALRFQFPTFTDRVKCVDKITDTVRQSWGVLVLNWHTHTLNPKYFSEEVSLLSRIVLRAKRDGAWIARPSDVIRHWENRSRLSEVGVTSRYCENRNQQVL